MRLIPSRHRGLAHEVFDRLGRALRRWLLGRISTMILVGLLTAQLALGASVGILGVLLADPLAVVLMVLVQLLYQRNVLGEDVKLP